MIDKGFGIILHDDTAGIKWRRGLDWYGFWGARRFGWQWFMIKVLISCFIDDDTALLVDSGTSGARW